MKLAKLGFAVALKAQTGERGVHLGLETRIAEPF